VNKTLYSVSEVLDYLNDQRKSNAHALIETRAFTFLFLIIIEIVETPDTPREKVKRFFQRYERVISHVVFFTSYMPIDLNFVNKGKKIISYFEKNLYQTAIQREK